MLWVMLAIFVVIGLALFLGGGAIVLALAIIAAPWFIIGEITEEIRLNKLRKKVREEAERQNKKKKK